MVFRYGGFSHWPPRTSLSRLVMDSATRRDKARDPGCKNSKKTDRWAWKYKTRTEKVRGIYQDEEEETDDAA